MRADGVKQQLKSGVYRALGEATSGLRTSNGRLRPTLRVLMYHKVNDLSPNPATVPIAVFAEQMAPLAELGYVPVSLEAVLGHCLRAEALPERAVLITFGDGYRDNLENAVPILRAHGYPAVVFVPVGYLDDGRPLPHEETLLGLGVRNPTLRWDDLAELEAAGVRVESHGVGHTPLTSLAPADALREIALSKLRLEDRLGREVEAFAFVKGSRADFAPEHASLARQAGYKLAFTSISGANRLGSDPFRLRRYNVEPYPPRTFELVLAGACDLVAIKDTVLGTRGRRVLNAVLGTASR